MEQVDVIEKYITIVLTVFDMLNVRFCNGSGAIKEEPPLDLHQMVVWNGGTDVTTEEQKFVPTFPDFRDFSICLNGIFSALSWPFPPLK